MCTFKIVERNENHPTFFVSSQILLTTHECSEFENKRLIQSLKKKGHYFIHFEKLCEKKAQVLLTTRECSEFENKTKSILVQKMTLFQPF